MTAPSPMISKSWYANIWIAGDERDALRACRQYCMTVPLCVSVTPTTFIYTAGAQSGVCVRFIQYPRFETPVAELEHKARSLAAYLMHKLAQRSYSIEFPNETEWHHLED